MTTKGTTSQASAAPERPPAIPAELVQDMVLNAHGNLQRVQELLEMEPALVNAAWDWGGGDWESALGSAAHMGRKDIATYLLERGARLDLFAAAMLGRLDIVRSAITAFPSMRHARGPHGIPLLTHAQAGGAEAAEVVRFLEDEESR